MDIRYIERSQDLSSVHGALEDAGRVALDCEAAGYHRYSDRLCLIQLTAGNATFLIDPLAVDPEPVLGPALRDEKIEVLMHGADYDVRLLDRDLGVELTGLIDTQIAAALLGVESLGLSALLQEQLGVTLSKKYQKADWAQRPLPEPMREYAAMDTIYLHVLADRLLAELEERGRLEWAREEFRELEKVRFDANGDRDPVTRVKVARDLDSRQVDRLRVGLEWRDRVARELDRAPFRVVGDPALIEVARRSPRTVEELQSVPGMNRSLAEREGEALIERLRDADGRPDGEVLGYPRPARERGGAGGRPPPEVEARFARLKEVRNLHAAELGLARGTLLPNGVLQLLAEAPPTGLGDLAATVGMRQWQAEVLGDALLDVLRKDGS